MWIWIYGDSPEQVQSMIETRTGTADTVVGTSTCAASGSTFPQSGLTPAISAAIQGKIDLLLVPKFETLGSEASAARIIELFQSYGVLIRSISN